MSEVSAKRILVTSFIVDAADITINLIAAVITGSVVMIAETLQGFADLTAVSFLIIGVLRASQPPTSKHPFGHGRELYFWALLSGLITFVITATLSFYLGLRRFLIPELIPNLSLAYFVLTFSVITNGYALSLNILRLSQAHPKRLILKHFFQSPNIETKTTFVLDLAGTIAASFGLVSLLLFRFSGNLKFDGIGAMSIGIILAFFSFILILQTRELLIGLSASRKIRRQIRQVASNFEEVESIASLKTIYTGSNQLLVHLDLHLRNKLTTDQIENLTSRVKDKVRRQVPAVDDIQIELTSQSLR